MKKSLLNAIAIAILGVLIAMVILHRHHPPRPVVPVTEKKEAINREYRNKIPRLWGEDIPGVLKRIRTTEKIVALTLDACGSPNDGYDKDLIDFLVREHVPATLFINSRWINKNPAVFQSLASNPLFEIENHGAEHKPASVNGKSVYGITGTGSPGELVDEIEINDRKIKELTGRKPRFYRSGTAYYDEYAVEIVRRLGYRIAGFSLLGDAGASWSKEKIAVVVGAAQPGDIIICHMNHPEKETFEGLEKALPRLKERGFSFVRLSDLPLQ